MVTQAVKKEKIDTLTYVMLLENKKQKKYNVLNVQYLFLF